MPRKKAEAGGPKYMTTFMVAQALGVSPPTVVNWVNSGLLPAHRTPGKHRRIAREDVRAFAESHKYPLPPDFGGEAPIVHTPATPPQRSTSAPNKVLVVDDNPTFCDLVRDYLTMRGGYEVETAASGFAAGRAVANFKPQVILMDILMPGMDGFEVLKSLKADPETKATPVIACTGYPDEYVEARVKREPFVDFLVKPMRLEQLAEAVARAINARTTTG